MKESKKLFSKKEIRKLGLRSVLLQSCFNYERMQGAGWAYTMMPFLKRIHKDDDEAFSVAMKDNMEFINTNPTVSPFLMGFLLSLEEKKEDRTLINSLKVALFGPLAGIGDALLWFTLLPIIAGICASFASQGSVVGPIIFFIVYLGIFLSRMSLAGFGYELGAKAIDKIKDSSKALTKAATTLGVTVIGALIATYVNIDVVSEIKINEEHSIALQADFFDKILPNVLPLGYTFLMYYLLKKKQVSPTVLILVTFVLAIVGSLLGVL
ncbi:PTS N-acetylgalactosamine transporter subunit IID [Clostridium algidicarnis]|uniref:PTS galactosamine transporter subunit IID n=1 Tax=Clostridium algidicarnis TaxID=37659 RepID=UPI001C0ACC81|nr:PTS galactosamine transporter subunit IID [Clostridium algidicarnis]MBU3195962.1 PTS N-acetylgalactosamine transporter subunit IID [Clostridium algidicarnis]MBU3208998.1 PTS N-acetylgalactosamine transporter subunit IID [Clostridium algidicarnis]